MPKEADISVNERAFILEALHNNVRLDGRALDQLRPLTVSFGEEYGHVKLQLGKTSVVVRISAEVTMPRSERENDGIFTVTVELNDMASPAYETGRQSELETHLARTLDRIIRRSNALDTESLCIAAGKNCWHVRADVHVVDSDGGLVDSCCLAIMTGLLHFRLPEAVVREGRVTVYRPEEKVPSPLNLTKLPLSTTFNMYDEGSIIVLDATSKEEAVSEGSLIIALDKTGEIALYTKPDGTPGDPLSMISCSNVALAKIKEMSKFISAKLEEDLKMREKKRQGAAESSAANER
ncbi:exosome complex component RRP45 [[Emmonsia] crescens]|uniref:Exosome complex component RRP45 n=2 Tax=[Emmonsia] crescens TaxID=73230 RepID=A0A2B7Z8C8_9EURO|nr:exosome complex component RRP45 [Emmonsia crescens UAMH 3008]PGH29845.1 exosome complex component RRP45 [Emmonsia crescens]